MTPAFLSTTSDNPHPERAKRILAPHPEVRRLFGRNPWTAAIAACLVIVQLAVAGGISWLEMSWPWALATAALIGANVVHALYAIVHESAHRLVFRSRVGNRLVMLLCNVPLVAPFAVALSHYHLVHHRRQGQLGRDPDLPTAWERRWFRGGPLRKLAYACLFPLLQPFRPIHPNDRLAPGDSWLVLNVVVQLVATATIAWLVGWVALLYLVASVYFWSGPHPVLFARFVQEHFVTTDDGHETHSYYGPLNHIALNVGYHVEHHDLPSIPWHRLPRLTNTAASFYDDRVCHRQWWRLGWQFLFDRRVQVASRVTRGKKHAKLGHALEMRPTRARRARAASAR
jgi:sphingolipid delta-4 desaturase